MNKELKLILVVVTISAIVTILIINFSNVQTAGNSLWG